MDTSTVAGNFYHFFAHGIHHLTPMDEDRITFPPTFSLVLGFAFFSFLRYVFVPIFSSTFAVGAGVTIGYMFYDILHFLFHHGGNWTLKAPYIAWMKSRHFSHHYANPEKNFGVTSPLFDIIFGTNQPVRH
jgi:4-hydroxysphinganine ceramide fatty acyl 2-hydroxylase